MVPESPGRRCLFTTWPKMAAQQEVLRLADSSRNTLGNAATKLGLVTLQAMVPNDFDFEILN